MFDVAQPLRFYDNEDYVLSNRQSINKYKCIPPLIVDGTNLLPFQILRGKDSGLGPSDELVSITGCEAIDRDGNTFDILENITFNFHVSPESFIPIGGDPNVIFYYEVVKYLGDSTISTLKYGIYHLHISDARSGEWWSDEFKVGSTEYTVKFEFTNSFNFNYTHYTDGFYYNMTFEAYTYDPAEYEEEEETWNTQTGKAIPIFKNIDKIMAVTLLGNQSVYDAIKFMGMHDEIWITNEAGEKRRIEIRNIDTESIGQSNHVGITIKYIITENQLNLYNKNQFINIGSQEGEDPPAPPDKGITLDGEYITLGGTKITI